MIALPLSAATLLFVPAGDPADQRTTATVAADYVQACFQERAMDAAFDLVADGVTFVDPTAEIWGGPASIGVTGREPFRKLTASWSLESSHLDVAQTFTSGTYAIYTGQIGWQAAGQPKVEGVPFCTILRVQDGVVTDRRDYGDYDRIVPLSDEMRAKQDAVGERGRAYFDAYASLDLEALDALLADDATFVDPTAEMSDEPLAFDDKFALLAMLEGVKGHVRGLRLDAPFQIACGTHVVFAGTARYEVLREGAEPVRVEHPFLMALTIEGERVVEHRRYLDHEALWHALSTEEKGGEKG